jgi:dTDP-4-dehydrorhamnose reductase
LARRKSEHVILIVGASGQLGSALADEAARRDLAVLAPPHAELDLLESAGVRAYLDAHRPTTVINCAAFHNVEQCEKTPAPAFAANSLAVDALAHACLQTGVACATVSTDYVFDGTAGRPYDERDAPNPLSAYGTSKLAGELLVRRHGPRHFIFRTSGVYGKSGTSNKGYTFIERVLVQAERGEPLRIVDDMTFSPSYAPHVARVMLDAIEREAFGTHHVAGGGATTWYAFAMRAFAASGLTPAVESVPSAAFPSSVRRPLASALVSVTLPATGIAPAPAWEAGLADFLAERATRLATSS